MTLLPTLATLLVASALGAQVKIHHRVEFALGDRQARIRTEVTGHHGEFVVRLPGWSPGYVGGPQPRRAAPSLTGTGSDGHALATVANSAGDRWTVRSGAEKVTLFVEIAMTGRHLRYGLGQRYPFEVPGAERRTERYHEAFVLRPGTTWLQIEGVTPTYSFHLPKGWQHHLAEVAHIGKSDVRRVAVAGLEHEVVLSGFRDRGAAKAAFCDYLAKLAQSNVAEMGPLPYESYKFFVGRRSDRPEAYGHARAADLTASSLRPNRTLARNIARAHLIAWEFPHFLPASRDKQPTLGTEAWFWLGAKEYLAELAAARTAGAGDRFWTRTLATEINRLKSDKRRLTQSIAKTGAAMHHPSEVPKGAPHPRLFGMLLCMLLDVEIRAGSAGKRSLGTALQSLRATCNARKQGYARQDIRAAIERAAGRALPDHFTVLHTPGELPFASTLTKIGVRAAPIPRTSKKPTRRPPRWRLTIDPKADATLRTSITTQ